MLSDTCQCLAFRDIMHMVRRDSVRRDLLSAIQADVS